MPEKVSDAKTQMGRSNLGPNFRVPELGLEFYFWVCLPCGGKHTVWVLFAGPSTRGVSECPINLSCYVLPFLWETKSIFKFDPDPPRDGEFPLGFHGNRTEPKGGLLCFRYLFLSERARVRLGLAFDLSVWTRGWIGVGSLLYVLGL